jgi:hypothetical protein
MRVLHGIISTPGRVVEVEISKNNAGPRFSAENILKLQDGINTTNGIIYIENS